MGDDQADQMIGQAAKIMAEALVHLLETEYELLRKSDAQQLRQDAADAPDGTRIVTVHRGSMNGPELLALTIGKTDHVALPEIALKALRETV